MSVRRLFVTVLICLVLFGAGRSAALCGEVDVELKERFFREAPPAWQAYLDFASQLQGKVTIKRIDTLGNQVPYRKNQRVEQKVDSKTGEKVTVLEWESDLSGANDYSWCLRFMPLWLPDLIKEPEFKIKSLQPHKYNGEDLVRLEFDYPKIEQKAMHIKGGWMILDPQHDWIMREYEVNNELRYTYHIREGKDEHPIIARVVLIGVGVLEGKLTAESVYETTHDSSIPKREFVRHGYQRSDIKPHAPPAPSASSRGSLWIIAVAGGLLVLCLGLRKWSQRVRARQAS